MKRIPALLISICIIAALCACGAPPVDNKGEAKKVGPAVSVSVQVLSQDCYSTVGKVILLHYSDYQPTVTISGAESAQNAVNQELQAISTAYSKGGASPGLDEELSGAKAAYAENPDRFLSGAMYIMERTARVERGDEGVLSFSYTDHRDNGKNTPDSMSGVNFDTATGSKLALSGITDNSSTLSKYCASYIARLAKSPDYAGVAFSRNYESAIPDIIADGQWYFSHDGLSFISNPGVLASASDGALVFTVPYGELASLLKPSLLPADRAGDSGDLALSEGSSATNGTTVGSAVLDKDGRKLILTAKGSIYDVSLSSVEYTDENAGFIERGTHMYFSDLSGGQSVGIQTAVPEIIPNLQISWRNADGTLEKRLISESGKDGSINLISVGNNSALDAADITGSLPYSADLDGDGKNETISLDARQDSGSGEPLYSVHVAAEGGLAAAYDTDVMGKCALWLADIDGDGKKEIFFDGDEASDDFTTWCLRYSDGRLAPVPFSADGGSGDNSESFRGWVEKISDKGGIVLGAMCDVLGSYEGVKSFEYSGGALRPAGNAVWAFSKNDTWITASADVPAVYDDGGESAVPAGTSIKLASTDGSSWVRFQDDKGRTGSISIESRSDYYGWYISGKTDSSYFDNLPYAG